MLSTRRTIVAAALAALAATGVAVAQPGPAPRGPVPFGQIDSDADGYVSVQEFQTHRAQQQAARAAQGRLLRKAGQAPDFAAWDLDDDARLTPAELTAGQQARMQQRWLRPAGGMGPARRPCWRAW